MDGILQAILLTLVDLLNIYIFILVVSIILSWTPMIHTRLYKLLEKISDPFLNIFRGWIQFSGFDFSPMLGILLLTLLAEFLSSMI